MLENIIHLPGVSHVSISSEVTVWSRRNDLIYKLIIIHLLLLFQTLTSEDVCTKLQVNEFFFFFFPIYVLLWCCLSSLRLFLNLISTFPVIHEIKVHYIVKMKFEHLSTKERRL